MQIAEISKKMGSDERKIRRKTMTAKEKKLMAQDLIMRQISIIGYGTDYEDFKEQIGNQEDADKILKQQMDRIAKMFGFSESWFS